MLDVINTDVTGTLMTMIMWKIPNYVISQLIYLYYQVINNNSHKIHDTVTYTIMNFRQKIVESVSDAIIVMLFNIITSMAMIIIAKTGLIGRLLCSYLNAIAVHEFRPIAPTLRARLRRYTKDPIFMMIFGYPLMWIQLHEQLSWFSIHHLYNLMLFLYIEIIWSFDKL